MLEFASVLFVSVVFDFFAIYDVICYRQSSKTLFYNTSRAVNYLLYAFIHFTAMDSCKLYLSHIFKGTTVRSLLAPYNCLRITEGHAD